MPYFERERFWNYPGETAKKLIIPSCAMYFKKLFNARAHDQAHLSAWQVFNEHITANIGLHANPALATTTSITWIGHASFLIKVGEYTILTDPLFNNLTPLFPRHQAPGIARDNIPTVDVVLISHNHWDHLEKETTIYLAKKYNPLFLVPQGDKKTLLQWGIKRVTECNWWEAVSYALPHSHESLTLTFLPAYHWSGRGMFDTNRSLWGSWMIAHGNYHCYFAGDTADGEHFEQIAKEFPSIHTTLMPIGPCEPHYYLQQSHINAEQAGKAFLTLNAQHFIPMHWGTFGFGIDRPLEPLHRLEEWWDHTIAHQQSHRMLIPLRIGQQLSTFIAPDCAQTIITEKRASLNEPRQY